MAKKILSEPEEVTAMDGRILPLACTVEYISFSAHADFVGTSQFIETLKPSNIVLVHGEKNEMLRLKNALVKKTKDGAYQPTVATPANMEELVFEFRGEKSAKAIGSLATDPPVHGKYIEGLLVEHDFHTHLMAKEDLMEFTQLVPSTIRQLQHIPFHQPWSILVQFMEQMFDDVVVMDRVVVTENENENENDRTLTPKMIICAQVSVLYIQAQHHLVMEWEASPVSDMIADSVIAIMMQAQASPASFRATQHPTAGCRHRHDDHDEDKEKVKKVKRDSEDQENKDVQTLVLYRLLKEYYGQGCSINPENPAQLCIDTTDGHQAVVDMDSSLVESKDAALEESITEMIVRLNAVIQPIPTTFTT